MDVVVYALLKKKLESKANLVDGKIPASELPSYVDDVINGYYYNNAFYEDSQHTSQLTPEEGKIYVDLDTNNTYRWSGVTYVQIGWNDRVLRVFNPSWTTNSTIADFCADVNADSDAVAGMLYLGELTCSDLPFVGNADAVVEIVDGTGTSGKVIHIGITSGNVSPYRWEYTYWNNGSNVSGWISFMPSGSVEANPTLAGTEAELTGLQVGNTKYKITQKLTFSNVTASNWVVDNTYADYGYKCDLTCQGITANSVVEVMFGMAEATSGNYAPVCETSADTVTIYSKVNTSITIPVIKEI